MQLITSAQRHKLLENGRAQRAAIDRQDQCLDFEPAVKLFTPDGNATWLLTELNPDIDLAFGLCDLGLGEPELGYVSLSELAAVRGPLGLPLERDLISRAISSVPKVVDLICSFVRASRYVGPGRDLHRFFPNQILNLPTFSTQMDHSVAVGAHDGEIIEPRLNGAIHLR